MADYHGCIFFSYIYYYTIVGFVYENNLLFLKRLYGILLSKRNEFRISNRTNSASNFICKDSFLQAKFNFEDLDKMWYRFGETSKSLFYVSININLYVKTSLRMANDRDPTKNRFFKDNLKKGFLSVDI